MPNSKERRILKRTLERITKHKHTQGEKTRGNHEFLDADIMTHEETEKPNDRKENTRNAQHSLYYFPSTRFDLVITRLKKYKRKQLTLFLAFVLTVATVIYAIISGSTLKEIKREGGISQGAIRVSQGAYVTIGRKDGVIAEFVTDEASGNSGLVMYFQNTGHLPAKFNWGLLAPVMTLLPSPDFPQLEPLKKFNPIIRTRNRETGSIGESGSDTIAGESLYIADVVEIPRERIARQRNANAVLTVLGAMEYCDEVGNYSCRQFILTYPMGPFKRFEVSSEYNCFRHMTQVANPDPKLDYLPACRGLEERQK